MMNSCNSILDFSEYIRSKESSESSKSACTYLPKKTGEKEKKEKRPDHILIVADDQDYLSNASKSHLYKMHTMRKEN